MHIPDTVTFNIPADWDSWLAAQGSSAGFCQTSAWARIHAAVNGAESCALSVEREGARVAGALVSLRPAQKKGNSLVAGLRLRVAGQAAGTLECFEGPVFAPHWRPDDVTLLLTKVRELASQLGVNHVRFSGPPPLASWSGDRNIRDVFVAYGYEETPWLTSVVDLTQSEDALRASLRQAARKGIRKSQEAALSVMPCQSHDEYRDVFCPAYYGYADAGPTPDVARRIEAFWDADRERSYCFFVVRDEFARVHATIGTYRHQGVATEITSRRTSTGPNLSAQDLLHWEAMLHHKRIGDTHFNLAGHNPHPADDKEAGIRRFKEKWGGDERPVPVFTWTHSPPIARVSRWLKARAGVS